MVAGRDIGRKNLIAGRSRGRPRSFGVQVVFDGDDVNYLGIFVTCDNESPVK